jgi:hypothetical protein
MRTDISLQVLVGIVFVLISFKYCTSCGSKANTTKFKDVREHDAYVYGADSTTAAN